MKQIFDDEPNPTIGFEAIEHPAEVFESADPKRPDSRRRPRIRLDVEETDEQDGGYTLASAAPSAVSYCGLSRDRPELIQN